MYWPNWTIGKSPTVEFNSTNQWPYTIPDSSILGIDNGMNTLRYWNTKANGAGKSFSAGTVINDPAELMEFVNDPSMVMVLYAFWQYGTLPNPEDGSYPTTLTNNEMQLGANDGSIKNLDLKYPIEVSANSTFANGATMIIQPGDTSVLPSGTYYVRWAGNEQFMPSNNSVTKTIAAATIAVPTPVGGATAESGKFKFQVTVPANSLDFYIPTSGSGAETTNTYDWNIDWGDGNTQVSSGTSDYTSAGIRHTYASAGTYLITITPNGSTDAWLAAFGFSSSTDAAINGDGANIQANRDKVSRVYGPMEPLMTRTAAQIANGTAPDFEWRYTFYNCTNLVMSDDLNFIGWDNITKVGDSFAAFMFDGVNNDNFTMNSVFNLPQHLTTVGEAFAYDMFGECSGARFNMNSVFNLPQGITMCDSQFAAYMFDSCNGNAFTMNSVFNFLQNIDGNGDMFGEHMFYNCNGDAFNMNSILVLPKLVATDNNSFLENSQMFAGCTGSSYKENDVLRTNMPISSSATMIITVPIVHPPIIMRDVPLDDNDLLLSPSVSHPPAPVIFSSP